MANKPPTPYPDGNVWRFKLQVDGVRKTISIPEARNKREAEVITRRVWEERKAKATLQRLAQGKVAGKAKDMTLTMACGTWLQEHGRKLANPEGIKYRLDIVAETIGPDVMMTAITTPVVKDFKQALERVVSEKTGKPLAMSTIRAMVGELKRIINWARRKEIAVPFIDWKKDGLAIRDSEINERDRVLEFDEIEIIKAEIRPDYLPVFEFALCSAFRLENLTGLKWSCVNWRTMSIVIVAKGGKKHVIPITSDIEAILRVEEAYKVGRDSAVFTYECARSCFENATSGRREIKGRRYPIRYSAFSSYWTRFGKRLEELGIPHVTPHDLRRTSITNFAEACGDIAMTAKHAGHSDPRLTMKVYNRIKHPALSRASNVAAEYRTKHAEAARVAAAETRSVPLESVLEVSLKTVRSAANEEEKRA